MPTAPDPVEVIEGALESMRIQSAFKTSDHLNAARYLLAALEAAGLSVAKLEHAANMNFYVPELPKVPYHTVTDVDDDPFLKPERVEPLFVVVSGRVAPPKAETQETDQ